MDYVTALPGPLGDGCYVLAAHRPDAVSWAHPLGAHMIEGETWPSLADVQALIADCTHPKKA